MSSETCKCCTTTPVAQPETSSSSQLPPVITFQAPNGVRELVTSFDHLKRLVSEHTKQGFLIKFGDVVVYNYYGSVDKPRRLLYLEHFTISDRYPEKITKGLRRRYEDWCEHTPGEIMCFDSFEVIIYKNRLYLSGAAAKKYIGIDNACMLDLVDFNYHVFDDSVTNEDAVNLIKHAQSLSDIYWKTAWSSTYRVLRDLYEALPILTDELDYFRQYFIEHKLPMNDAVIKTLSVPEPETAPKQPEPATRAVSESVPVVIKPIITFEPRSNAPKTVVTSFAHLKRLCSEHIDQTFDVMINGTQNLYYQFGAQTYDFCRILYLNQLKSSDTLPQCVKNNDARRRYKNLSRNNIGETLCFMGCHVTIYNNRMFLSAYAARNFLDVDAPCVFDLNSYQCFVFEKQDNHWAGEELINEFNKLPVVTWLERINPISIACGKAYYMLPTFANEFHYVHQYFRENNLPIDDPIAQTVPEPVSETKSEQATPAIPDAVAESSIIDKPKVFFQACTKSPIPIQSFEQLEKCMTSTTEGMYIGADNKNLIVVPKYSDCATSFHLDRLLPEDFSDIVEFNEMRTYGGNGDNGNRQYFGAMDSIVQKNYLLHVAPKQSETLFHIKHGLVFDLNNMSVHVSDTNMNGSELAREKIHPTKFIDVHNETYTSELLLACQKIKRIMSKVPKQCTPIEMMREYFVRNNLPMDAVAEIEPVPVPEPTIVPEPEVRQVIEIPEQVFDLPNGKHLKVKINAIANTEMTIKLCIE